MAPTWLTVVAWAYLAICFGCAAVIACDIFVNGRRQSMGVMNVVFPITALYFGPLAVAFYLRWGRAAAEAEYLGDYVLALAFGIAFQYFAIAPMRGLGLKDGLKAAAKADFISLTFFEVGRKRLAG